MAKQTLPLKDVPKLKEIREELGYPHGERKKNFMQKVNSYAAGFKSSRGISGASLQRWADPLHQAGLLEITTAFLDKDGYGSYFWPDDKSSSYFGKLQYSRKPRFIKQKMSELFYRNSQERRRNQSKAQTAFGGRNAARAVDGDDDHPIDLTATEDLIAPGAVSEPGPCRPRAASLSGISDFSDWEGNQSDHNNDNADEPMQNGDAANRDIYDIPASPDLGLTEHAKGKRPAQADDDEAISSNKRPKKQETTTKPVENESTRRAIHRERTQTQYPGFITFRDDDDWGFDSSGSSGKGGASTPTDARRSQRSMGPPPAPMDRKHREDTTATLGRDDPEICPESPPIQKREGGLGLQLPLNGARDTAPSETHEEARFVLQEDHGVQQETACPPESLHQPSVSTYLPTDVTSPPELARPGPQAAPVSQPRVAVEENLGEVAKSETSAHAESILRSDAPSPSERAFRLPSDLPSLAQGPFSLAPFPYTAPVADMRVLSAEPPSAPGLGFVTMPVTRNSPDHPNESVATPQTMIRYRVQISRTCRKRWDLEEAFQQKSLKDLVDGLPIEGKFKGLHLRLDLYLPKKEFIEDEALLGDEDGFQIIKRQFRNDIEEFQARHPNKDDLFARCFVITLTPLWEDDNDGE